MNYPDQWWESLSRETKRDLERHGQLYRYRTGQTLLRADRLPHQVVIIKSGLVRLLVETPDGETRTLAKLPPHASLGWAGLLRAQACETAIAMEETVVLSIPSRQFMPMLERHPDLAKACQGVSLAELAQVLMPWLWQQPRRCTNPIDLIHKLVEGKAVRASTAPSQTTQAELALASGLHQRWLVIDQASLQEAWQVQVSTTQAAPPSEQKSSGLNSDAKGALPAPQLPPPSDPEDLGLTLSTTIQRQPPDRARGPEGTAMACMKRLAEEMGFPLPRDTIAEVLADCETRLGGLTLLHLGQLLEGLGMDVRPLHCSALQVQRVEPPALLHHNDGFMLLEATRGKTCLIADPSEGLLQLNREELQQRFPEGMDLILIRRGINSDLDRETAQFDLQWFWESMRPYRPQMVLLLISGAASKLLELVFPLATMQIIDAVVGGNNASLLLPIGIVMAVAIIAMALLGWLRQLLLTDLADRIDTRLGSQIVSHLFRLPMRFFDRRTVGDLSSRLYDLQRVRSFITDTASNTALDLVFMPIMAITLFIIQPILALIVLAEVPLLVGINLLSGPIAKRLLTRRNIAWGKTQGFMVEVISAIRTVKSQNFITQARWRWLERYQRFAGEDYRLSRNRAFVKESTSSIEKAIRVILFMTAAWMALNNWVSVGVIFAVYILSSGITSPLINIPRVWDQYRDARAAMDAVADVLGQTPEESLSSATQLPLPAIQGAIRLENVSFSYGLGRGNQLERFNLEVNPGSFVGLVGLSGSGKSTVVQLLDGLYTSDEGRVFVDGIDISKVQISSLRRQVGFVPQDSILFDGTVLDNIRLNYPDASYESIIDACKTACAHEFIMQLSDGYNSKVGERGGGLSGGQKQRLAIARMVLQNPRMVILDEATSALDADTEKRVITNLRQRFNNKTFLFVTHRLGNLRKADRILVMDRGQLVEDGSWQELIRARGIFSTLALQQHENTTPESALAENQS